MLTAVRLWFPWLWIAVRMSKLLTEWFAGFTHGLPSDDVRLGISGRTRRQQLIVRRAWVRSAGDLSLVLVIVREMIRHSLVIN